MTKAAGVDDQCQTCGRIILVGYCECVECEYCAQPSGARRVVERPTAEEVASLAAFFWVRDPSRLVFCDDECRTRWHALRRQALWDRHGPECACVECLGRG